MSIRVFIQNEAGSYRKNYHNEKTLVQTGSTSVSRPYPFPYGFIVGTTGADGCNVDCFVLTERVLRCGDEVDCDPIGLMEQIEDGIADHNILAVPLGEDKPPSGEVEHVLTEFVTHVFDHIPHKRIQVGRFLGPEYAHEHIDGSGDRRDR